MNESILCLLVVLEEPVGRYGDTVCNAADLDSPACPRYEIPCGIVGCRIMRHSDDLADFNAFKVLVTRFLLFLALRCFLCSVLETYQALLKLDTQTSWVAVGMSVTCFVPKQTVVRHHQRQIVENRT